MRCSFHDPRYKIATQYIDEGDYVSLKKYIMDHGIDVNVHIPYSPENNIDYETLFWRAFHSRNGTYQQSVECANVIIECGLDLEKPCTHHLSDITPLHLACYLNWDEIVKALLDAGANKDAKIPSIEYIMSGSDFAHRPTIAEYARIHSTKAVKAVIGVK